ncbi:MAG: hypothetical protein K8T91_22655 [Planctomycetes bacterium]|nr:hypothetical protein [Planctomycetota bacterium]
MIRQITLVIAALLVTTGGCTCSSQPTPPATATTQESTGKLPVTANPTESSAPVADASAPQPADGDRPKLKARWSRSLSDQIDRVDGGTSQERDLIRETLRKNDDTLDRAFHNMPGRIEAANNTHDGPRRVAIPAP